MAFWWAMPVEVKSACRRLTAEGLLDAQHLAASYRRVDLLADAGIEVEPSEAIRTLAASAIDRYELRAADAMQLAASLLLCRERPSGRTFVCFDKKLSIAADLAGFTVLPPQK